MIYIFKKRKIVDLFSVSFASGEFNKLNFAESISSANGSGNFSYKKTRHYLIVLEFPCLFDKIPMEIRENKTVLFFCRFLIKIGGIKITKLLALVSKMKFLFLQFVFLN